jgi:NarL family two-component system response regulator LiaR
MDGPAATARIRDENPEIQVIALTTFTEQDLVQRAIGEVAVGYLLKDVHLDLGSDPLPAHLVDVH